MRTTVPDVYRYSGWLFILLLCYTPIIGKFIPATNFGAGVPDLDPLRALAYLLVMTFSLEYSIASQGSLLNRWIGILCAYALVVVLSPLWSAAYSYTSVVIQELFNSVILPVLLAVIAMRLFRSEMVIKKYCTHVVYASIVLSLIALVQFIQGSSVVFDQERSTATFNNPNLLAVYLVLCLAVVLYATDTKMVARRLGYVAQILLVLAVFTTVSRKGLGTMAIAFIFYYWATKRLRTVALLAVLIAVVGLFAGSVSDFSSRFAGQELQRQFEGKAAMAMAGVNMFADNPVLGLGFRGYYENFGSYFPGSRGKYDAHNEYVTALANYGLLGFIPFMAVFLYPLAWGWKRMRLWPPPAIREERLRLLVGLISLITFMISQFYAGFLFYQNIVVFLLYANVALMLTTPSKSGVTATAGAKEVAGIEDNRRILQYRTGHDRK